MQEPPHLRAQRGVLLLRRLDEVAHAQHTCAELWRERISEVVGVGAEHEHDFCHLLLGFSSACSEGLHS